MEDSRASEYSGPRRAGVGLKDLFTGPERGGAMPRSPVLPYLVSSHLAKKSTRVPCNLLVQFSERLRMFVRHLRQFGPTRQMRTPVAAQGVLWYLT